MQFPLGRILASMETRGVSGEEKYRIAMATGNRLDKVLRVLKLLRLCISVNGYPT